MTDVRPTLAVIARRAGVSVSTVSKVIHGRPDVGPATRATVRELLETTGYWRSNDVAAPPSRLCELVLTDLGNPWSGELLAAFQHVADLGDLRLAVSVVSQSRDYDKWLDSVMTSRPYGVLAIFGDLPAGHFEALRSVGIRCVSVGPGHPPPAWVPVVDVADADATHQATRHLLGLGHRRIAMISGPRGLAYSEQRIQGYRAALAEDGIEPPRGYVRSGAYSEATGYRQLSALLKLDPPPTAVIAGNDQIAVGVYEALRDAGRQVPEVSVIGIDDQPEARWLSPPLTSMQYPLGAIAGAALELLTGPPYAASPAEHRRVSLTLVQRGSTAAPSN